MWNKNVRNIKKIMEEAMKKTLERGNKYHEKVMEAFDRLPKDFPTKPFFQITLWYYNKVLNDKVKEFLKGETYPVVEPKLSEILNSLK
jgi:predicted secreted hydrolase